MSEAEADRMERNALTKLLSLRDQKISIEMMERKYDDNTDNVLKYDEVDVKPTYPG